MLLVGSCFSDHIGHRIADDHFPVVANPFGVMYNPASILHTLQRIEAEGLARPSVAILTLGTNHVYVEKATGEIVDNCQKRPQALFDEQELSVDECASYLQRCVEVLRRLNSEVNIIFTVSPIRYRKYGFHGSQLSKATLLMAIDKVTKYQSNEVTEQSENVTLLPCYSDTLHYFPAYEILNDELRDYRFYATDMLHPSEQAVDYIYRRFQETYFSPDARRYVEEWRPIREALAHKPFHPDSPEYQDFFAKTQERLRDFEARWGRFLFF